VIILLLSSSYIICEEKNAKEIHVEIGNISIDKQSQSSDNTHTLYFQKDKLNKLNFMSLDITMYMKPIDIVLVLDSSSSMNNRDIKDSKGNLVYYRMDIQKRIARQIIESLYNSSNIGLVIFGSDKKDEISKYDIGTTRQELIQVVDQLQSFGSKTKGGEALNTALEMAHTNDRQCLILVISDGLEVGEGFSIADFIVKAQNYKIIIITSKLGTEETDESLQELATKTKGKYFLIIEEREMYSLTYHIIDIINNQSLNNVILEFLAPEELYIDNIKYYQGQRPQQENLKLQWNSILADETIEFTTIFGVTGEDLLNKKFFEIEYGLSYTNQLTKELKNLSFTPQKINVKFESIWEYYKRIIIETFNHYKIHISLVFLFILIILILHFRWKNNRKRLLKEQGNHLLQAKIFKEKKEFEGALSHLEKADKISIKLNKKSDPNISKEISEMEKIIEDLEKEKKRVQTLTSEITNLIETIKRFATDEFLQHSLQDFEILKEELGNQLKPEILGEKVTSIFKTNEIEHIKKLKIDLTKLKKNLLENKQRIEKANHIYKQTKPTLEVLLQKNNLDVKRVTEAIEDTEVPHLVLNYVINDHPELQSTWNEIILDKLKDEREAFKIAENLMNQNEFKKAENLLLKAQEKAKEIGEKDLLQNIEKLLHDCRRNLEHVYETLSQTYLEGMDLFKEHQYSEAQSKFQKVITLGEQIHDESWIEKGKSMIQKCEQHIVWEEQTQAIIGKMKEFHGIASTEWLGRYVESENIDELLRYIRSEYNKKSDDDSQYRIYPFEQPPVFIDFYALANYIIEHPGEIGGKIPPNYLYIPVQVQKELLELLKPSRGG
jgi:hypothetical protein